MDGSLFLLPIQEGISLPFFFKIEGGTGEGPVKVPSSLVKEALSFPVFGREASVPITERKIEDLSQVFSLIKFFPSENEEENQFFSKPSSPTLFEKVLVRLSLEIMKIAEELPEVISPKGKPQQSVKVPDAFKPLVENQTKDVLRKEMIKEGPTVERRALPQDPLKPLPQFTEKPILNQIAPQRPFLSPVLNRQIPLLKNASELPKNAESVPRQQMQILRPLLDHFLSLKSDLKQPEMMPEKGVIQQRVERFIEDVKEFIVRQFGEQLPIMIKEALKAEPLITPKNETSIPKEEVIPKAQTKSADPVPMPLRGAIKLLESFKKEERLPYSREKPSTPIPWVQGQQQRLLSEAFQVLQGIFLSSQGAQDASSQAKSIIPQWVIAPYLVPHRLEVRKGKKARKKRKEEEEREKRYPFEG